MDMKTLFKITQGLFITGAREPKTGRFIGSCIDAVLLAETNPGQIIASMGKVSYTARQVRNTGRMSLSVLPENADLTIIRRFGMQSSENVDKWQDTAHVIRNELPFIENMVAGFDVSVRQIAETDNHFIFLCDVEKTYTGSMATPMTYAFYQQSVQQRKDEL